MNYQEYKVSEWYNKDKLSEINFNELLDDGQKLCDSLQYKEDDELTGYPYILHWGNQSDSTWVTGVINAWKEDVQDFEAYKETVNQFNLSSVYTTKQLLTNLKNRFIQKLKNIFTL